MVMQGRFLAKTTAGWINLLVSTLSVCLLTLNVVLLKQNRSLRSEVESLRGGRVVVGQQLLNLAGVSLDGHLRSIALPSAVSERLLIIGFSPGCRYCQANQNGWNALAHGISQRNGWRVIWVSRDPAALTVDYCRAQGIPFSDVLAEPPERTYSQLGLRIVPKMILVGPGGVVEMVWSGQLNDAQWKEAFSFLKVSGAALPGSRPALEDKNFHLADLSVGKR
jgi:hypothetical protein